MPQYTAVAKTRMVPSIIFKFTLEGYCLKGKRELLLSVENQDSFDEKKWLSIVETYMYKKVLPKHLPTQFSDVLRNMTVEENVKQLLDDIQNDYPDAINVCHICQINTKIQQHSYGSTSKV
jgi:hypothetical protein